MSANNLLCNIEDSLLVVVDIQTKLTSVMPMKVLARLQRNSGLLLKSASLLGIPIIATEQYPKGLGAMEPEIVRLLPDDAVRIDKTCFSCVAEESFLEAIQESGRKQIILIGMEAHICVQQTTMDLLAKDYSVFIVTDAICSRQRENYETALHRMGDAGAAICDSESVVFEWLRDAKHEHFKYISSLVR